MINSRQGVRISNPATRIPLSTVTSWGTQNKTTTLPHYRRQPLPVQAADLFSISCSLIPADSQYVKFRLMALWRQLSRLQQRTRRNLFPHSFQGQSMLRLSILRGLLPHNSNSLGSTL